MVTETPRRRFLKGAALAATGAATLGFPMVARAQGPISMRWQSTWPQKDIFHEYALDFAKKVNDMTGGDLKIDVLPAGAGGRGGPPPPPPGGGAPPPGPAAPGALPLPPTRPAGRGARRGARGGARP